MKRHGLTNVRMDTSETDVWFSSALAKQEPSFAQVWYDSNVERKLGPLIERYGMKYPQLLIFSGQKAQKTNKNLHS
jgi:hypothetical protein